MEFDVFDFPNEGTEELRVIDRPTAAVGQPTTPRALDRDTVFFTAANPTRDLGQVGSMLVNGMENTLVNEAESSVNNRLVEETSEDFDTDNLVAVIEEMRDIDLFRRFLPQSMIEAVRSGTPGAELWATETLGRLMMTQEMINQRQERLTDSTVSTIGNIAEILVDPLDAVHQNLYRELTGEYEAMLSSNLSPEEFRDGFSRILDKAQDAGFLSHENRYFFGDFVSTLSQGVYSPGQRVRDTLGALDVLSLSGAALVPASRRLVSGLSGRGFREGVVDLARDSLTSLTAIRPTRRTEQAVDDYLQAATTIDDPGLSGRVGSHISSSAATPTTERALLWSAASHTAVRAFELSSTVLDAFRAIRRDARGIFDASRVEALRSAFVPERLRFLRETGESRVIDVDVALDSSDNVVAFDVLGTVSGRYFKTQGAAQRAVRFGDEVTQVGENQFGIIRRHNISPDLKELEELGYTGDIKGLMLWRSTDPESLGEGFWARWGSPLAQSDESMTAYLFRGESLGQRAVNELNHDTKKITRGMRARQQTEVYRMFEQQQNSPITTAWTRQQFEDNFYSTFGREPTKQQTALYLKTQERLDAQLFIDSDTVYRRAVDMGAKQMRVEGNEFTVTPVNPVADTFIYDVDTASVIKSSDLTEDAKVYRTVSAGDFPGNTQYVTAIEPELRAVRHSDFFARNSGGHRAYILNDMQFVLKQEQVRVYADGSTRTLAPRTLLGTRTREEASRALDDVNNIIDELVKAVPVGSLTPDEYLDAVAAASSKTLDDVVQRNNGFYPDMASVEDLVQLARDRGIDLRTKFKVVGEGQPLETMARLDDSPFFGQNLTHGDVDRLNALRGGRGSIPLAGYGGRAVQTRSTQDAIEGSIMSSAVQMTEATYRMRAGRGLINAALETGVMKAGYNDIRHLPLRTQLERIKRDGLLDVSGATGVDELTGRKLSLELDRLLFRMQRQSWSTRSWNNVMRRVADQFYKRGYRNTADWADRRSSDPLSAFRGWAFDAYLGVFNVSQLLMQSVQVVNIMGIAGLKGVQGGAMYSPMRFAISNGTGPVTRRIAQLMEPVTGMDVEQFEVMVEMFRRSGRGYVDNNLAEMTMAEDAASSIPLGNTDIGRTINQTVRDFRESGRVFFKEGDLVARITAFNTAFLEYVARNGPVTKADDARAIRYIAQREQVLTQGMTAASRQAYEQAPFMQFLTYQLRINEALFAGTFGGKAVLTPMEKLRLLTTHAVMFGAAASTVTSFGADYLSSRYDMEVSDDAYRLARGGALDYILSEISGIDVAASSRFSSSEGMWQIMRSLGENHPAEFLIGPSGELATNALGVLYGTARSMANGRVEDTQVRIADFVRLTSTGNYTFNAINAYTTGRYLSRQWGYISDDIDPRESIALAFGIPLEEIDSLYRYAAQDRIMGNWRRSVARDMTRLYNLQLEAIRRGDWERANEYIGHISIRWNSLDPWEKEEVERYIRNDGIPWSDRIILETIQRDIQLQRQVQ